jgi:hypothetical protein
MEFEISSLILTQVLLRVGIVGGDSPYGAPQNGKRLVWMRRSKPTHASGRIRVGITTESVKLTK